MYILVSPFTKTFDEIWLVYFVPSFLEKDIKIWHLVEIPMKSKIELAIILEILPHPNPLLTGEGIIGIDISKIKSIISIKNNNILLKEYQFTLVKWIAKYYFCSIHNALNLFFPKNLREKLEKGKLEIGKTTYNPYLQGEGKDINKLSEVQNKAFNEIKSSKNNKILFYWITWSGKTEIYIKLIDECIRSWKQALLLIPEIILTAQISTKIQANFGEDNVIILNSSISPANKTKHWLNIYSWQTKIIVGTRSSLFYPFNDLGLIIIDEEHDRSYISDKNPRYHSNEVAEKISDLLNIKMILGSGTPSIKNMYKSIKGNYKLVTLLEKYK